MCRISDELFNEGFGQGVERARVDDLRAIALKLGLTPEQALDVLGVARDEWSKYLALV